MKHNTIADNRDSNLPCHADAAFAYLQSRDALAKHGDKPIPVLYKDVVMWEPVDYDLPPLTVNRI